MKHHWAGCAAKLEHNNLVSWSELPWSGRTSRGGQLKKKKFNQCLKKCRSVAPKQRWGDPLQAFMKSHFADEPWQSLYQKKKTFGKKPRQTSFKSTLEKNK